MKEIINQKIITKLKKFRILAKQIVQFDKMILYGSYAYGNPGKDSDIDVAIIVKTLGKDYLEKSAALFHLVWDIDTRIEPVLLSPAHDKSGFLESIEKRGIVIPV